MDSILLNNVTVIAGLLTCIC